MVGGDGVTQYRQYAGVLHVLDGVWLPLHAFKEGRVLNIGRFRPLVDLTLRHFDGFPRLIAFEDGTVLLAEHLGVHLLDGAGDIGLRRPDVFQIHRVAVAVLAERVGG